MRTDAERIAQYIAKYVPTTVGLKVAAQLTGMKSGFASAINALVPIEVEIQTILNGLTVPTIQYPFYLNFGREIWRLQKEGIGGGSLTDQGEVLSVKYQAQGLTKAHLNKIALDVFGVALSP